MEQRRNQINTLRVDTAGTTLEDFIVDSSEYLDSTEAAIVFANSKVDAGVQQSKDLTEQLRLMSPRSAGDIAKDTGLGLLKSAVGVGQAAETTIGMALYAATGGHINLDDITDSAQRYKETRDFINSGLSDQTQ